MYLNYLYVCKKDLCKNEFGRQSVNANACEMTDSCVQVKVVLPLVNLAHIGEVEHALLDDVVLEVLKHLDSSDQRVFEDKWTHMRERKKGARQFKARLRHRKYAFNIEKQR